MGKADLHIHTSYSYDSSTTVPAVLEWASSFTDLDIIAVTDHNRLEGAWRAMDLAPKFDIQVIPGCEISTLDGHILALFIEHPIPAKLSAEETILRAGEQGGLCIVAHPEAFMAHGLNRAAIQRILQNPMVREILVGIETWNTGLWYQGSNRTAQQIQAGTGLSRTGSSDAHVVWTIGQGYTAFSGSTPADLRRALEMRQTTAQRLIDHYPVGYWPRHFVSRLLRKMGWVTWIPEPNASFKLRRLAEVQAG